MTHGGRSRTLRRSRVVSKIPHPIEDDELP